MLAEWDNCRDDVFGLICACDHCLKNGLCLFLSLSFQEIDCEVERKGCEMRRFRCLDWVQDRLMDPECKPWPERIDVRMV